MENYNIALDIIAASIIVLAVLYFICLGQSLQALLLGLKVTPLQIIFMKLRKTDVKVLILNLAKSTKGGLPVTIDEIEAHMIAGGDISNVINGLLYAKAHDIPFTFQEAAKIDMRKHDVISHLKNTVQLVNQ